VRRLEGHAGGPLLNSFFARPTLIVFAPDGRTVLTSRQNDPALRLWEVASGKELRQLQQPELVTGSNGGLIAAGFSPTGRVVAVSRMDGRIELWEAATGKVLREFRGHRDSVHSLVFAADGRRLASAGSDSLVFLWDVTGGVVTHPRKDLLKPVELDGLWKDLADVEATKADRAKWTLVTAAPQSVPWLRGRLRPSATPDSQRLARLLTALDSARFAEREKAAAELRALGRAAESALRRALEGRPSVELRRRIERLLEGLSPSAPGGLGQLRGLEVLELAGTAEARQALRELARGAPEVWLTQEAERTLQRLVRH
jgi:hypothetical protein